MLFDNLTNKLKKLMSELKSLTQENKQERNN